MWGKPIGNISEGNLASPPRTQFTYFDLIGLAYDSTTYMRTYREPGKDGARVSEGRLWHHVLRSYISKSLAAINVLAVLVRVGNQLKPPALVYSRIRRSLDSLSTLASPFGVSSCSEPKEAFPDYLMKPSTFDRTPVSHFLSFLGIISFWKCASFLRNPASSEL